MKILKRIKGLVESLTIIDRYLAEHNAPSNLRMVVDDVKGLLVILAQMCSADSVGDHVEDTFVKMKRAKYND